MKNGYNEVGMSLRDRFAAAALTGMLARADFHLFPYDGADIGDGQAAENAYQIADAMLKVRGQPDIVAAIHEAVAAERARCIEIVKADAWCLREWCEKIIESIQTGDQI